MKQIDMTIVIAMFNAEKTIKRTIDSIQKQTVMPKEILIVNDGSSDASEDIVIDLCNSCALIKYHALDKNYGAAYAKTYGVKCASSSYSMFLDADDELAINALERIEEVICCNPDYICSLYVRHVHTNKSFIEKAYINNDPYAYLMKFPFHYLGLPPSVFRTDYFIKLGGFGGELYWGDGLAFIRKYVKTYKTISYLKEDVYTYYHNTYNISKKNRNFENYLRLFQRIYDENLDYLSKHPKDHMTWLIFIIICELKIYKKTTKFTCFLKLFIKHPLCSLHSVLYTLGKVGIKFAKKISFS